MLRAAILLGIVADLAGSVARSGAQSGSDHMAPPIVPAAPLAVKTDSTRYSARITDNNLVGVTITNYGFVGNNFINRSPSFEYPLGTGYDHLVRGGLWVGGEAVDDVGAFIGVSTAAIDGTQGTSAAAGSEYTPAGLDVLEESTLPNSKFYSPRAVSEQDFFSFYSDEPARSTTLGNPEPHRPLNILVRQSNYNWSFSDYQNILIFHYTITNTGAPLRNVWVGWYSEFASGNKNAYGVWPPLASGSAQGTWYTKKWVVWDDSLKLFREHYCATQPMPSNCNLNYTPYWIGIKMLGVSPGNLNDTTDKKITVRCVNYSPRQPPPDSLRYQYMSAGTVSDFGDPGVLPTTGDPTEMIAVGPFREIDPGDSIHVDWALVGGSDAEDAGHYLGYSIQKHAKAAQRAFDFNYIVPVPPPSPRLHVVARDRALDLYWEHSPELTVDPTSPDPHDFEGYRVYVGEDRLALHRIAEFDKPDTTGFNTGFAAVQLPAPVTFPGDATQYQYKYTIDGLRDGFRYFCAVTAYDTGTPEIESLESGTSQNKTLAIPAPSPAEATAAGSKIVVFPNPYRVEARWDQGRLVRDHYLWFANLPQRCSIKIFTLSGDLIFDTEFDGATYHGAGARGVYNPQTEVDVAPPTMSGAAFAWDLITRQGQAAATGLYLYSIEDRSNGKRTIGKFLIVKSDRES
jgi:hypothetical protein